MKDENEWKVLGKVVHKVDEGRKRVKGTVKVVHKVDEGRKRMKGTGKGRS